MSNSDRAGRTARTGSDEPDDNQSAGSEAEPPIHGYLSYEQARAGSFVVATAALAYAAIQGVLGTPEPATIAVLGVGIILIYVATDVNRIAAEVCDDD